MLGLFHKKEEKGIVAPCTGICVNLSEVEDPAFASKAMGDGFAVKPEEDVICAPMSGTVTMLFATKHAFGLKSRSGIEMLVHIGIDTVSLNGEGFTSLVKEGAKVTAGDPVIRVDRKALEEKGVNLTTMVLFTDGYDKEVQLTLYGQKIEKGQLLIEA